MFRTEIEIDKQPDFEIDYDSNILSLGSCFSENIGSILKHRKFLIDVNPFGILFNPVSIAKILELALNKTSFPENLYTETQGIWQHYFFHSENGKQTKQDFKESINEQLQALRKILLSTDTLLLTLGTSIVYETEDTKEIVANCHKQPSKLFAKRYLSVDEIKTSLDVIKSFLPSSSKIILTVSPIRHTKEGLAENNLSKSLLRVAINEFVQSTANTVYFPSYETLIDDLRDYRFVKEDLIHPNQLAIKYIWKKFSSTFINDEVISKGEQIEKLLLACTHKAFNPSSKQHQKFIRDTVSKMEQLQPKHNFSNEIEELKAQLI